MVKRDRITEVLYVSNVQKALSGARRRGLEAGVVSHRANGLTEIGVHGRAERVTEFIAEWYGLETGEVKDMVMARRDHLTEVLS
jgi:hypothetical protein